jgi:hypothetical protein
LEKLAMPIALHPDPLIASILPAAVYPLEIVMAARFVRDTNNLAKVDAQPWDENVKAVAKFPELIARMDGDLEWTVALGKAFLEQRKELMDSIQALRAKAQQAGNLQTTAQQNDLQFTWADRRPLLATRVERGREPTRPLGRPGTE